MKCPRCQMATIDKKRDTVTSIIHPGELICRPCSKAEAIRSANNIPPIRFKESVPT